MLGLLVAETAAQEQVGMAAFYSNRYHGARTYSGERYNKNAMTCAHKTYPMGTKLKVTCLSNNKSVEVRVNDRMSSSKKVIDLSRAAASKLGMISKGSVKVKVEVVPEVEKENNPETESQNDNTTKTSEDGKGKIMH